MSLSALDTGAALRPPDPEATRKRVLMRGGIAAVRGLLFIALIVAMWAISEAIDEWKLDVVARAPSRQQLLALPPHTGDAVRDTLTGGTTTEATGATGVHVQNGEEARKAGQGKAPRDARWKADSGEARFAAAGKAVEELEGRPIRDLAHDALVDATMYFNAEHSRKISLQIAREIAMFMLGFSAFVVVILSAPIGWTCIINFCILLIIRTICDVMVWEPMAGDFVRYDSYGSAGRRLFPIVGYFFSGHTAFGLLYAATVTTYPRRLAWRCFIGWFSGLVVVFIALAQLITRTHYMVDVVAGAAVSLAVFLIGDRWIRPCITPDSKLVDDPPDRDARGTHRSSHSGEGSAPTYAATWPPPSSIPSGYERDVSTSVHSRSRQPHARGDSETGEAFELDRMA